MEIYIICGIVVFILALICIMYARKRNNLLGNKSGLAKSIERTKKTEYYDDNRSVKLHYECIGDKKDGKEELYYPSGKINRTRNWNNGVLDGEMIVYYDNGNVYIKANYKNGSLDGEYTVFKDNGDLLTIKQY